MNQHLAAGAEPAELMEVLRQRQLIEPLPEYAHAAVAQLLNVPESDTATAMEPGPTMPVPDEPLPPVIPAVVPHTAMPPPRMAVTSPLPVLDAYAPAPDRPTGYEKTILIPRRGASLLPGPPLRPKTGPLPRPNVDPDVALEPPADGGPSLSSHPKVIISEYEAPPSPDRAPAYERDMSLPISGSAWRTRVVWLMLAAVLVGAAWVMSHRNLITAAPPQAAKAVVNPHPATAAPGKAHKPVPIPAPVVAPGTLITDCPTCPQMTVLPVGRFKQGSSYDDPDALPSERPQHVVLVRHPLAMSTNELTVDNFREFVTATNRNMQGCEVYDGEWRTHAEASWKGPGFAQEGNHPITCVSWNDAVAYAGWLTAKTGHRYRLPSASEWEYAARSGSDGVQPWLATMTSACDNANVADKTAARRFPKWNVFACKDGFINTAPVGSFKPNAFGLDDMMGNVFEWTEDCWHDSYAKAPIDGSARMDGDCSEHELRGGSWFSAPAYVRPAYRNHFATAHRSSSIGIRLVREMTP